MGTVETTLESLSSIHIDIANISAHIYALHNFIEQGELDTYWQESLQVYYEHLSVSAVRLTLIDALGTPAKKTQAVFPTHSGNQMMIMETNRQQKSNRLTNQIISVGELSSELQTKILQWESGLYTNFVQRNLDQKTTGTHDGHILNRPNRPKIDRPKIDQQSSSTQDRELVPTQTQATIYYTNTHQIICIPIIMDQLIRGGLTLICPPKHHIEEDNCQHLYHVTQSLSANALRTQYIHNTHQHIERINLLYQITQAITHTLDLQQVLNDSAELAAYVLNAQAATLFQIDESAQELVFMVTKGKAANMLAETRIPINQGVVGWVATNGKPLIVNDTQTSPLFDASVDSETGFITHNILCIPLSTQDRIIGVIEILNKEDATGFSQEFTQEDVDWLYMAGQHIAIALDNAQLFAREQQRVHELATLNAFGQTINHAFDTDTILHSIPEHVLDLLGADRCELLLVDPKTRVLSLFASAGLYTSEPFLPFQNLTGKPTLSKQESHSTTNHQPTQKTSQSVLPALTTISSTQPTRTSIQGDSVRRSRKQTTKQMPAAAGLELAQWCVEQNQPAMIPRAEQDGRYSSHPSYPELDKSSIAVVPLTHRQTVEGVIVVFSLNRQIFDNERLDLLQTFAHQAAASLRNAKLYENLHLEQERIITAQEEVRHQLARDLHDNTAQMLSLLIMNMDLTRQRLHDEDYVAVEKDLDYMEQMARQTNREVRTLLFELRPIILESQGLIPALHAYHQQLLSSMDIIIHLEAPPLPFTIDLQGASTIFSIIQEAVNNIRKHACAENIWIRVYIDTEHVEFSSHGMDERLQKSLQKQYLCFEIEDDGLGFDLSSVYRKYDEQGSFGLLNMNERADMLNGILSLYSPRPMQEARHKSTQNTTQRMRQNTGHSATSIHTMPSTPVHSDMSQPGTLVRGRIPIMSLIK
ncbi:MAG: GAF domain-containing sensor histidine kinase [Chloroflexota bacterium]